MLRSRVFDSIDILPLQVPAPGEVVAVADGVSWVRMPLPFDLTHINLWLVEDDDGWTIVDAGVKNAPIQELWRAILAPRVGAKPIRRVVCTHCHPDHMGLAGWLTSEWRAELWITREEWAMGRMFSLMGAPDRALYREHYRAAGCGEADMAAAIDHVCGAHTHYAPVPQRYWRLRDGDNIRMAGRDWTVMVALGHSFEHACLYCPDLGVMIGGDQFLPKITPAVLVHPSDPNSDPLREFLGSNRRFRGLPDDVRVLPSHNLPFQGLHARIAQYEEHHAARLETTLAACAEPASCAEIARHLFDRPIAGRATFFAIGETLSHLKHLGADGLVASEQGADGIVRYVRAG